MPKQIHRRLTPLRIREATRPGDYSDGNGLYLRITPSGIKHWVQRLTIRGRRRTFGLGSIHVVTLAQARARAAENKVTALDGGDPLAERRRAEMPTFAEAAATVIALNRPTWTSEHYAWQWEMLISKHANPIIGDRLVGEIDTGDVLAVLTPLWTDKHETGRRVRQRIGAVMDWAIASGYRADNPAGSALAKVLPKMPRTQAHQQAIPYDDVADAIRQFQASEADPATKLSFEFLILTATRSSETRLATWDEINWASRTWTIPAERMKGRRGNRREHRVPLSDRALQVLSEAESLANDTGLIFPSSLTGKAISDATHRYRLRALGIDAVPHGFRSSFRDWAAEQSDAPHAVMEAALAHVVSNATEAAYARSDLFGRRRELMQQWADYLDDTAAVSQHLA